MLSNRDHDRGDLNSCVRTNFMVAVRGHRRQRLHPARHRGEHACFRSCPGVGRNSRSRTGVLPTVKWQVPAGSLPSPVSPERIYPRRKNHPIDEDPHTHVLDVRRECCLLFVYRIVGDSIRSTCRGHLLPCGMMSSGRRRSGVVPVGDDRGDAVEVGASGRGRQGRLGISQLGGQNLGTAHHRGNLVLLAADLRTVCWLMTVDPTLHKRVSPRAQTGMVRRGRSGVRSRNASIAAATSKGVVALAMASR